MITRLVISRVTTCTSRLAGRRRMTLPGKNVLEVSILVLSEDSELSSYHANISSQ